MSLNVKNKLKVLFIIVLVILVSCGKKQVKNVIKETEITEFVKQNNKEMYFNSVKVLKEESIINEKEKIYVSDHFPILAEFNEF